MGEWKSVRNGIWIDQGTRQKQECLPAWDCLPLQLSGHFLPPEMRLILSSSSTKLQSLASRQWAPESNQEHWPQLIMLRVVYGTSLANSSQRGNPFSALGSPSVILWCLPHTRVTEHRDIKLVLPWKLLPYFHNTGMFYACCQRRKGITNLIEL